MKHYASTVLSALFTLQLLVGILPSVRAAELEVTGSIVRGPLDHVIVTPVAATLQPGDRLDFQATAYDSDGVVIGGLPITWAVVAGGGTIDQSGMFTAGLDTGTFPDTIRATATEDAISRSGFASVTITAVTIVQEIRELLRNTLIATLTRTVAFLGPLAVALTTLTTIVQIATAIPALTSLSNLLLYTSYLWSALLELLGFKRRRRPWGIVYNAESKEPIPLVVVQLIDEETGQSIEQRVTDPYGRFGFLVKPGRYRILPIHPNFNFPSKISPEKGDLRYTDLYHGEEIPIEDPNTVLAVNIPLDPVMSEAEEKGSLLRRFSFRRISLALLVVSVIFQGVTVFLKPTPTNWILFGGYLTILVIMSILLRRRHRTWGVVYDAQTKQELAQAQVFITQEEDPRFASRKVTDEFGRFYLLLPKGTYRLAVQYPEYTFPAPREQFGYKGEAITVTPKQPLVHVDIPLVKTQPGEENKS